LLTFLSNAMLLSYLKYLYKNAKLPYWVSTFIIILTIIITACVISTFVELSA
jgi:hypothetical protein